MTQYYTVPVEVKVGNSRIDPNSGDEVVITRIHNWVGESYLDLEIVHKVTGLQGWLRVNKPTGHTS